MILAQQLANDSITADVLADCAAVPLRVAANAICGRPVATVPYLRICLAMNFDPAPMLQKERIRGPDFDFSYFRMGLKIRRGVNRHSARDAGNATGLSASTICRAERGEPMQIGVVLALCRYIGVHPFGYMRDCST